MELTAVECRVVGCLIEKERATPQNYPLTVNALRTACNQTTGRDPIAHYDDRTVEQALGSLRRKGVTRIVYSTSNRAPKHRHVLGELLGLDDAGLAVMAVLLLRGVQTVGEIKGRSERLHAFADLGAVQSTLDQLAAREPPLVVRFERRPGHKDVRWGQLLGGPLDEDALDRPTAPRVSVATGAGHAGVAPEVERLNEEVAQLRRDLTELRAAFQAFRDEFS